MKAHFFDAYGTLFDVHSAVRKHAALLGNRADRLSTLWRDKQLEYSWVHALMEDYVDFFELTRRALEYALRETASDPADPASDSGNPASDSVHLSRLMESYRTLDAYPEVRDHLGRLKTEGTVTGILSNGSPGMLADAVASAGLGKHLDHVLSVDAVRTFKTRGETYRLVLDAANLSSPGDVVFHSSNRWDVAGAVRFGFETVWVNRTGRPDEYPDHRPDRVVASLAELAS